MKNPFSLLQNATTWKLVTLPCHTLTANYIRITSPHLEPQTTKYRKLLSFLILVQVKKTQSINEKCVKKPFSIYCHTVTSKHMTCLYHPLTCNYIMISSCLKHLRTKKLKVYTLLLLVQV